MTSRRATVRPSSSGTSVDRKPGVPLAWDPRHPSGHGPTIQKGDVTFIRFVTFGIQDGLRKGCPAGEFHWILPKLGSSHPLISNQSRNISQDLFPLQTSYQRTTENLIDAHTWNHMNQCIDRMQRRLVNGRPNNKFVPNGSDPLATGGHYNSSLSVDQALSY